MQLSAESAHIIRYIIVALATIEQGLVTGRYNWKPEVA